jgi:prefoldin subunit 5
MGQEDDTTESVGLPVETVAEAVSEDDDRDPEAVRETLAEISEDGTVTRTAIDEALADLSKVVATPETRVEITRRTLAAAREAAPPVAEADAVSSRLDDFETELSAIEARVDALGSRLSALVERAQDPDDPHAIGEAIREVRSEATDAQRAADSLAAEIEDFERMLRNPDRWADELHADIDAIEESIRELQEVATGVSDNEAGEFEREPALVWADATLQSRTQKLFIEDVRAELEALRRAALDRATGEPSEGLESRLDDVAALRSDVRRRLEEAAESTWKQKHGEVIESFARTLENLDSPVDWAEVQAELEQHRGQLVGSETPGHV